MLYLTPIVVWFVLSTVRGLSCSVSCHVSRYSTLLTYKMRRGSGGLEVLSTIMKNHGTPTEARLAPDSCTVQYKQLFMCTYCLLPHCGDFFQRPQTDRQVLLLNYLWYLKTMIRPSY